MLWVTGDSEGTDNPPPPHVILEAKPGVSEAEFLLDVDRVRALVTRHGKLRDELTNLHTAFTGPPDLKKAATVWALVAFLLPDMPPDLSPKFPPLRSRVLGCRHAHRDGVSLFGRALFLRPGHLRHGRRAQPGSSLAAGHRQRRRAAGLTQASTRAA